MGATTSVQTDTANGEGSTGSNEVKFDSYEDEDEDASHRGRCTGDNRGPILRYTNHSLALADTRPGSNTDVKSEHMQISVKYLSEENVRLQLANEKLLEQIKCLRRTVQNDEVSGEQFRPLRVLSGTNNRRSTQASQLIRIRMFSGDSCDRDNIFGESTEDRLKRLEKHLASERQEKWSAIEFSEKCRIDLVNSERDLAKSNQEVRKLMGELEAHKKHIKDVETARKFGEEGECSGERRQTNGRESLQQFRKDLSAKREARQRALSAITAEMNGLREQLQKEKNRRCNLERELETSRQNHPLESILSDNSSLRNEIEILRENAERLKNVSSENVRLKFEAKRLNEEMDSLNLNLGELKFEYYEEKRKHERTMDRLKELENACEGNRQLRSGWEEEREKFYEKYDQEKEEITKRTNALKEVITITRQMLAIRESQVQELKVQLKDIEESVKKSRIMEENGLKAEYEKQLENIKSLKSNELSSIPRQVLYEERVRLMETEKKKQDEALETKEKTIDEQSKEIEDLRTQLQASQRQTNFEREECECLDRELRLTVARCKDLENEISLINNMFTQMLLGPFNTGQETDLDKLTELLQENHDLIAEMTTKEDGSEIASVLPKLLLDLITQVDRMNVRKEENEMIESCDTISEQSESLLAENQGAVLPILSYKDATLFKPPVLDRRLPGDEDKDRVDSKLNENLNPTVQEIASNLPKVWKVLMELLSHHSIPEEPTRGDEKQCYKKVDTPNGPRTVISVSKTFIRLKDLILEKKALQKELTRLKQLNSHLETRLDDQEKRYIKILKFSDGLLLTFTLLLDYLKSNANFTKPGELSEG
ncbi:hypothetical protein RUM44_009651 [Polyplax serrata]|uniref:Uncharacterized protein n=1 Tax=Polyplax serrata TaxID=468196 RepID=A0ABR1ATA7_POLSC